MVLVGFVFLNLCFAIQALFCMIVACLIDPSIRLQLGSLVLLGYVLLNNVRVSVDKVHELLDVAKDTVEELNMLKRTLVAELSNITSDEHAAERVVVSEYKALVDEADKLLKRAKSTSAMDHKKVAECEIMTKTLRANLRVFTCPDATETDKPRSPAETSNGDEENDEKHTSEIIREEAKIIINAKIDDVMSRVSLWCIFAKTYISRTTLFSVCADSSAYVQRVEKVEDLARRVRPDAVASLVRRRARGRGAVRALRRAISRGLESRGRKSSGGDSGDHPARSDEKLAQKARRYGQAAEFQEHHQGCRKAVADAAQRRSRAICRVCRETSGAKRTPQMGGRLRRRGAQKY